MPQDFLDRRTANFTPLSPLSFIRRSRDVYPQRPAVIYGARRYTWAQVYERAARLASALTARGIGRGDTVAIIAANTPELFEAHFGVPMAGAILNTINTRLDAETIAYILGHGEARVLIADTQFSPAVKEALTKLGEAAPLVVDIVDAEALRPGEGERLGALSYEDLLAEGDAGAAPSTLPTDEWTPSRSTTPRAPAGDPRACSTTTAAPIS